MANQQGDTHHKELKVGELIQSGRGQTEVIERAPGIFESRGIGNSYLIKTSDGDVLVNAGALGDARRGQQLFSKISGNEIRHIILTQSHPNQFGGLEIYKSDANQVIAHQNYTDERRYASALQEHMQRGSRRIFSTITGDVKEIMPTKEVMPDLLIGEYHEFELGERRFELHWAPGGETRSGLVVWLPDEKIALVGNLFGPLFGNHPNLNTMRGDKPRSAMEFIRSAKLIRSLRPLQILTGHEDIRGDDHIQNELTRLIDSVQWVHDRTIEGMNAGIDLRTLMRDIQTPAELTLTEDYGKVSWNVRAIWHEYTGWFDPSRGTTELYGVPPSSIAPTLVELAGGTAGLIERAENFTAEGKPLEALYLLDIVLATAPDNGDGKKAKVGALTVLLQQTGGQNLWERMWISAQIRELE